MARQQFRRKLNTYRSLYRLNYSFNAIVRQCWQLQQAGFLPADKMQTFRGLVREMQSMFSHDILDRMYSVERDDSFHFGKVRIAWEHHLNPTRPAFGQQSERGNHGGKN